MAGGFALYIKEKYHIPYVITEHFTGFARNKISEKNLFLAEKVFTNSNYNIAVSYEFVSLLRDKFNQDFHYIPNIVNIHYFNLKNNKNNKTFEFINIGFLDKKKNQAMLIKSFYKAFQKLDNVKLTIVGDGIEFNNLNQLIKKLDMQSQITLYGRADRCEVKKLLQNSDAFVLSSKYETFGVVLIEAMACGLPVISTKSGGPESIIQSNNIGFLTNINEDDLAQTMNELYQNRTKYDSKYIRKYTEDNFSEKAIYMKLKRVYERVLK